nr:hypothetical protein [Chloroflexia bacterium]
MPSELKSIPVPPESELARLLEDVGEESVLVPKEGVRYRLSREHPSAPDDPWVEY